MKNILLISLMLFLFSCEDEAETPATPPIPMVKTEELKSYVQGNLQTHLKYTYNYDSQNRVSSINIENILYNITGLTNYDYSIPNQVKEIQGNNIKTFTLDANGRATNQTSFNWHETYTYDTNGRLLTYVDQSYNKTYLITNNNTVEIKTFSNASPALYEHEKYSYNTLPNTIGNENKGMKFLGKSNANFIIGRQKVAGTNPLYSYNYSSSYDTNNRLTNYSWTRIGGNQNASFQASYTYYP